MKTITTKKHQTEIYMFPNLQLKVSSLNMQRGRMDEGGKAVEGEKAKIFTTPPATKVSNFGSNLRYLLKDC